uniref:Uncharacterized protein n=1 Tax=Arundo donax TaxID=35708 RepID=A0A0A8Z7X7_ARUDO
MVQLIFLTTRCAKGNHHVRKCRTTEKAWPANCSMVQAPSGEKRPEQMYPYR